jgi:hypothetical protein
MYLYSRTTSDDFVDAFLRSELRREQFSLPALRALYEHLSDLAEDIGEPIEWDMIATCCDWVECSLPELKDMYPDFLLEAYERESSLIDVLREHTQVIEVVLVTQTDELEAGYRNSFLVQEF